MPHNHFMGVFGFKGVFGTLLGVLAFWPVVALADPLPPAVVQPLTPVSYQRLDAHADPRGGTPVYLTGQDLVVTARVQAVYRVVVLITGGGTLDYARTSGRPDATGRVTIPLHLPYGGEIYAIQSYATIGQRDEWDLTAGSFRVMAPDTAQMTASDAWTQVRRQLPAAVPVYRPSWLPARFQGTVSVEVPDSAVSGGPAYRVGYRSATGNALIFALGPVNSGPPVTTAPLALAGTMGKVVTIASGWWPQRAVLWQERKGTGKPLAYTVQAMGVSRKELLRVAAGLTAASSSAVSLPQAGGGGGARENLPGVGLLLVLAGSLLLVGRLGRTISAMHHERR